MSYDLETRSDTPLALKFKERIQSNGPILLQDYIADCMWDETYGFYSTRNGIGAAGHFITAPEISQIFGELLGLWSAVVWREIFGGPSKLTIAEFGPGRGTMVRDAMRAARVVPGFLNALDIYLLEPSPTLAAIQRETLQGLPAKVTWGTNLTKFTPPAVILANEFLDAWPVTQWVRTAGGWQPRTVELDQRGNLCFGLGQPASPPEWIRSAFASAPLGAIVEDQRLERLVDGLARVADADEPVAALFIDYGQGTHAIGDTLQAIRGHRAEHPLASPGEADLSVDVDFARFTALLRSRGFTVEGPVTQAEFLASLGIVERASRLMMANPQEAGAVETSVARLISPSGMGSRFKVVAARSSRLASLPGFENAQ